MEEQQKENIPKVENQLDGDDIYVQINNEKQDLGDNSFNKSIDQLYPPAQFNKTNIIDRVIQSQSKSPPQAIYDESERKKENQLPVNCFISNRIRTLIKKPSNEVWRQKALNILFRIKKIIEILKRSSTILRFRRLEKRHIQLINDETADYDYYQMNGYFARKKGKLEINKKNNFDQAINAGLIQWKSLVVISPESNFKLIWDSILFTFLLMNIFFVPFHICFDFVNTENLYLFELVVYQIPRFFFLIDILLGFLTGFYERGMYSEQIDKIAKNYLKFYFLVDALSVFEYFSEYILTHREILYAIIVLAARSCQISQILNQFEESFEMRGRKLAIYRFSKLIVMVIFVAHCTGCIFYISGQIELDNGNPQSWHLVFQISHQPVFSQYIISLYWAIITMITVGYGDITPQTIFEREVVLGLTLLSCGMFAFTVNQIGSIFDEIRNKDVEFKKQINLISMYLKKRGISRNLLMKVKHYCQYIHEVKSGEDLEKVRGIIDSQLHYSLQNEVLTDINLKHLQTEQLFQLNFSERFLTKLSPLLTEKVYGPDEVILHPGQKNEQLIIFMEGKAVKYLQLQDSSSLVIDEIKKKTVFGSKSFFSNQEEELGVQSVQAVKTLELSFCHFRSEIAKHREDEQKFFQIRDDIVTNGQKNGITDKCESCDNFNHTLCKCPMIHFDVPQYHFISKLNLQKQNRQPLKRREQLLFFRNSVTNSKCYARLAIQNMIHNSIQLQTDENELVDRIINIEQYNMLSNQETRDCLVDKDNDENIPEIEDESPFDSHIKKIHDNKTNVSEIRRQADGERNLSNLSAGSSRSSILFFEQFLKKKHQYTQEDTDATAATTNNQNVPVKKRISNIENIFKQRTSQGNNSPLEIESIIDKSKSDASKKRKSDCIVQKQLWTASRSNGSRELDRFVSIEESKQMSDLDNQIMESEEESNNSSSESASQIEKREIVSPLVQEQLFSRKIQQQGLVENQARPQHSVPIPNNGEPSQTSLKPPIIPIAYSRGSMIMTNVEMEIDQLQNFKFYHPQFNFENVQKHLEQQRMRVCEEACQTKNKSELTRLQTINVKQNKSVLSSYLQSIQ